MARPLRRQFAGATYHVTARGNGRQVILRSDGDCLRFMDQLRRAVRCDEVVLYAWAAVGNHFHLLCRTPQGNLDRFMQRLLTAYGMYFRYRHARPGHCFQGRYGAKLVEVEPEALTDRAGHEYLLRLTRYIHLNPVKTRAMRKRTALEKWSYLRGYRWSSLHDYLGCRGPGRRLRGSGKRDEATPLHGGEEPSIVNLDPLALMGRGSEADNRQAYREYMRRMVDDEDETLLQALGADRYAIGEAGYVRRLREEMEAELPAGERGADVLWEQGTRPSVDEIEKRVARAFRLKPSDLHAHGNRAGPAKAVAIKLACRLGGLSHRAAGARFGVSGSAAGKQRTRLASRLDANPGLDKTIRQLDTSLRDR